MKKIPMILGVLLVIALLIGTMSTVFATTEYTYVPAYLRVPSAVGFTLWFPGGPMCVSSSGGACTTNLNFTSSDGEIDYLNGSVDGTADAQDETTPIFEIKNTGNVALNMSIMLNASEPSGWELWAAKTFAGMNDGSEEDINESNWWVFNSSLPVNNNQTLWVWANTTAAPGGTAVINFTISGND